VPVPADVPRFHLLDGPSPLHRWERFSQSLGGRTSIWAKREDLLPLAFGGNKLRNLEFHVGAALAEGADMLVTSGRRWSNHCRLTAAAGARAGLGVHLVVSGPATSPPNPGVVLDRLLGATVHQARTADRAEREALVEAVVGELRSAGRRPYVVPVGGSGLPGVYGQLLAAEELREQASAAGVRPDVVVLPSATGGTQAGLAAGLDARVVGVAVAHPGDVLRPAVDAAIASLGGGRPAEIVEGFLGDGYGRPTAAATEATELLARSEGVLVDPIYTAKALAGLVSLVRSGELDGQTAVFWHAGGLPGLFEPLGGE
jgi:1-aminocyclopropane-1-carboxylate deaminase/D-cysteine desulfhydrase-like pyridoxal-dependent ACC family enzyme